MQDSWSINSNHGVTESISQLLTKQFFIFPSFCSISPSNKTFLGQFVFLQESKLELVKIPQEQETNRKETDETRRQATLNIRCVL